MAVLGPGRGERGDTAPQFCFRLPSFVVTYKFFATITHISDFFLFPNFRKVGKFAASIERPKTKSASASAHDPLTIEALPWT